MTIGRNNLTDSATSGVSSKKLKIIYNTKLVLNLTSMLIAFN